MEITIPELSLVVLVGPSGAGKSTFAARHFSPTEVLSSDTCRAWVSDNANDQSASQDAFEVLYFLASKRLARGKLTVIDATNVRPEDRQRFLQLAKTHDCFAVVIVFDLPTRICLEHIKKRANNSNTPAVSFVHIVNSQRTELRRSLKRMGREGFRYVHVLKELSTIDQVQLKRVPLWSNLRNMKGPFDIIGDIHGCASELEQLLSELGYELRTWAKPIGSKLLQEMAYSHPEGRKVIFVGDLVDRGPRVVDTLRIVASMVHSGNALCVPGNHDVKLLRRLQGKGGEVRHGLAETLNEIQAIDESERELFVSELLSFLDGLISHYVLDDGRLVVAHAGLKEAYHGRSSGRVREFALYGDTTGETDEFGLPVRLDWAADYRGQAMVVYGHTPVAAPEWVNHTVNIDTGCVFGGSLTALRYPEREFLSVPSERTYYEPSRPIGHVRSADGPVEEAKQYDSLVADDLLGDRSIETELQRRIRIPAANAAVAFESIHRSNVVPNWLIYLPPTMSPCETSQLENYLEYPTQAFEYFAAQGLERVICEEKHMGSRAVVVVCKEPSVARSRFGLASDALGAIYTRSGRKFFNDAKVEESVLELLRRAATKAGFWDEFHSDWLCLDCEIMPWSEKAQELLRQQYAPTGAAGSQALEAAIRSLEGTLSCSDPMEESERLALLERLQQRKSRVEKYIEAYRNYCWEVESLSDLKIAPFHFLASEGQVHSNKDHLWHMQTLVRLCDYEPQTLHKTRYLIVDVKDTASVQQGVAWWHLITEGPTSAQCIDSDEGSLRNSAEAISVNGDQRRRVGEGMVVKPLDWIVRGPKGLVQPAIKCRGKEYLRIIYGPEYDLPSSMNRLRSRGLGAKRSLALREFSLGLEALERFTQRAPLRRVHECVFGVLALESEPVDPRL